MRYQNTSKFNPNFDPYVIKIHRNSNNMWLLKCARSSAFVSFRQLWSALVGLGPLRSAVVGFGKSWSVLVDFDRNSCLNFLFRSRSNFLYDLISGLIWPDHLIWSGRMSSVRNSWSNFLFALLVQISWSNLLIHLYDHALLGLVRISIELPVRSDLWSDLTWSFDLIWSDLIRSKLLIIFLDHISCSSLLIKFLDPSFRSWYLFIQISSNVSFNFVCHPFRSVPFLFGSLFYRVQISCSNLLILLPIMCLFLQTPFSSTVNGYWQVLQD